MATFSVNAAMKNTVLKVIDGKSFDKVQNIKYQNSKGMNHNFTCDSELDGEALYAYLKSTIKKDPLGAALYFRVEAAK